MPDRSSPSPSARLLAVSGAALLLIGLLTGGLVSAAMTGKTGADLHASMATHLNGLMGAFLLFGVGWTLPMLRYGEVGQKRLAWGFIVPAYMNWFVTLVKAFLHVSGVDRTGDAANDAVFVALSATVVAPSLIASVAWLNGFRARATAPAASSAIASEAPRA